MADGFSKDDLMYIHRPVMPNGARETELAFFLRVWAERIASGEATVTDLRRTDPYLYQRLSLLKTKKGGPSFLRKLTPRPPVPPRPPLPCDDEALAEKRLARRIQMQRWRAIPANREKMNAARRRNDKARRAAERAALPYQPARGRPRKNPELNL